MALGNWTNAGAEYVNYNNGQSINGQQNDVGSFGDMGSLNSPKDLQIHMSTGWAYFTSNDRIRRINLLTGCTETLRAGLARINSLQIDTLEIVSGEPRVYYQQNDQGGLYSIEYTGTAWTTAITEHLYTNADGTANTYRYIDIDPALKMNGDDPVIWASSSVNGFTILHKDGTGNWVDDQFDFSVTNFPNLGV